MARAVARESWIRCLGFQLLANAGDHDVETRQHALQSSIAKVRFCRECPWWHHGTALLSQPGSSGLTNLTAQAGL